MRGQTSPLLLLRMIPESKVRELVDARIEGSKLFVVDVHVNPGNKINVTVDGMEGVSIEDCIDISRGVDQNLDREAEDFELEVSSAGLDAAFKVLQQYKKNIGREVKIYTKDGRKHEGVLSAVEEDKVSITYDEKVRIEGRKKRELVTRNEDYFFVNENPELEIRDTKVIISFK